MAQFFIDSELFKEKLTSIFSPEVFDWIKEAIESGCKNNFFDRLPRNVITDAYIDNNTLVFILENGSSVSIDGDIYTMAQSSSVSKEFYVKRRDGLQDDNMCGVIIFNC